VVVKKHIFHKKFTFPQIQNMNLCNMHKNYIIQGVKTDTTCTNYEHITNAAYTKPLPTNNEHFLNSFDKDLTKSNMT
jgi:hypothetical protein